jgi:hypothetical protein
MILPPQSLHVSAPRAHYLFRAADAAATVRAGRKKREISEHGYVSISLGLQDHYRTAQERTIDFSETTPWTEPASTSCCEQCYDSYVCRRIGSTSGAVGSARLCLMISPPVAAYPRLD